jgi:hypothetical protein
MRDTTVVVLACWRVAGASPSCYPSSTPLPFIAQRSDTPTPPVVLACHSNATSTGGGSVILWAGVWESTELLALLRDVLAWV